MAGFMFKNTVLAGELPKAGGDVITRLIGFGVRHKTTSSLIADDVGVDGRSPPREIKDDLSSSIKILERRIDRIGVRGRARQIFSPYAVGHELSNCFELKSKRMRSFSSSEYVGVEHRLTDLGFDRNTLSVVNAT